jgi:hypothetical protein
MEIDQYWDINTKDLAKDGWHVKEHYAHMFFFNFLRLSPSYNLARKAQLQGLSTAEKKNLPKDFKKVLETYELLGDVHNTLFRHWWQRNGHEVFGMPYALPTPRVIAVIDGSKESNKNCDDQMMRFLQSKESQTRKNSELIISVPIDQEVKNNLALIRKVLIENKNLETSEPKEIKPKILLYGKRFNSNAMMKGFGLLMLKSAFPEMENWRLGVYANLSPSYSPALDKNAPRKTENSIEANDRVLMGKITSRALLKYQLIAENAARGKFLCEDEIEMAKFDYQSIRELHKNTMAWEEKEIERVQKDSK